MCQKGLRAQAQLVRQNCLTDELFSKYANAWKSHLFINKYLWSNYYVQALFQTLRQQ